jgi:hypothetical protein
VTRHMRQRNHLVATPGMPVRSTDSRRLDVDHNTGTWTSGTRHIGNAERGTDDVEDNRTHSLVLQRAAVDRLLIPSIDIAPARGIELRTEAEVDQSIELYTYELKTTDCAPPPDKQRQPIQEAERSVNRYFDFNPDL